MSKENIKAAPIILLLIALMSLIPLIFTSQVRAEQDSSQETSQQTEEASNGEKPSAKMVRVGWYETPFNQTDQFGRRSGYAYEYQRKITAYTGWEYEYVDGTWPELLEKLENGEIDLMSDVSYTPERAEKMLYPSLSMGSESYYLFVSPDNKEITADDFSTLDGKKVGVTKDSVQQKMFADWAASRSIEPEIVPCPGSEDESLQMLEKGELDAFITLDAYSNPALITPIVKIGSSDFFFAVNKDRPDLLNELDIAMSRIQDENQYYNQQLNAKHLLNSSTNLYLSSGEKDWLEKHGKIRVGYQDNYLAFCAKDPQTGELTGALKDYLEYASTGLENATLEFEAYAYPTAADALAALKRGEVDCMFPANLTDYDGEQMNLVMTPPLMRTEMDAVVRESEQKEFVHKEHVVVAVNEGNTNYEKWLLDNYPGWEIKYFPNTPAALDGIATGEADCIIISNYRFGNIANQCEKLHLTTVYTGVDMDYYLAVNEGDTALYSILSRVTGMMPDSVTHAALTYYSTEDVKVELIDVIRENIVVILLVAIAVLLIVLVLALRNIKTQKKVLDEERMIGELNKKVFIDALTSVRNKGAYNAYIEELQGRLDAGEDVEFAIGVFDCDDLKEINDNYGHDKGDIYIRSASHLICRVFKDSPVFRIGGDEFAVVMDGDDFKRRDELADVFEQSKEKMCNKACDAWEKIHVTVGIAVYDPDHDADVSDTSRRADKVMYENKRMAKKARAAASEASA